MDKEVPGEETIVGEVPEPGKWIRRGARTGREGLDSEREEREERREVIEEACLGMMVVLLAMTWW